MKKPLERLPKRKLSLGLLVALGAIRLAGRVDADYPVFTLDSVSAKLGENGKVYYTLEGRLSDLDARPVLYNVLYLSGQGGYDPTSGLVNESLRTREGIWVDSMSDCQVDPWLMGSQCHGSITFNPGMTGIKIGDTPFNAFNFHFILPITAGANAQGSSKEGNRAKVKAAFDRAFVEKYEADLKEAKRKAAEKAAELTRKKKEDEFSPLVQVGKQNSSAALYVLKTPTPGLLTTGVVSLKDNSAAAKYVLAAAPPRPPYGAAYTPSAPPASLKANGTVFVSVTVQNLSSQTWPAGGAFRLANHWYRGGREILHDGVRTLLPVAVVPGASLTLTAKVATPPTAGVATLRWDMIQESVAWFSDKGVPMSGAYNVNVTP